jgi:hypothetical protein
MRWRAGALGGRPPIGIPRLSVCEGRDFRVGQYAGAESVAGPAHLTRWRIRHLTAHPLRIQVANPPPDDARRPPYGRRDESRRTPTVPPDRGRGSRRADRLDRRPRVIRRGRPADAPGEGPVSPPMSPVGGRRAAGRRSGHRRGRTAPGAAPGRHPAGPRSARIVSRASRSPGGPPSGPRRRRRPTGASPPRTTCNRPSPPLEPAALPPDEHGLSP